LVLEMSIAFINMEYSHYLEEQNLKNYLQ
jgi:hypothetical protein